MTDKSLLSDRLGATREIVPSSKQLLAGKESLTYGELHSRVDKLSTWLSDLKLVAGSRVVIVTRREAELVTTFVGLLLNSMTTVVLDPDAPAAELDALIRASDPSWILVDKEIVEAVGGLSLFESIANVVEIADRAKKGLMRKFVGSKKDADTQKFPNLLEGLEPNRPREPVTPDLTALILFTSGTTSTPKGVELTNNNLIAQLNAFVEAYDFNADVRFMNPLPMHHTDGLTQGALLALFVGATVVRTPFSIQQLPEFLHAIYRERITHLIAVPPMLAMMQRLDDEFDDAFNTPDFRFVISTAGFLDAGIWSGFEARFSTIVVNVYGLTETVSEALYCGPKEQTRRIGTVGKPIGCDAKVVDENGQEQALGDVGELVLKGDIVMKGYFRAPEATQEVLREGWLLTGDLAICDADGFFSIVGRKKSVIIRGGINVYPADITHVLLQATGVLEAETIGVQDLTWGERVICAVVFEKNSQLSSVEIFAHCRAQLAPEKVPDEIVVLDELPRGASGKVVQSELKAALLASFHTSRIDTTDVSEALLSVASRCFNTPVEALTWASNPDGTPGWNSLAHVKFLLEIETVFDVKLTPKDVMNIKNLGTALELVESASKN